MVIYSPRTVSCHQEFFRRYLDLHHRSLHPHSMSRWGMEKQPPLSRIISRLTPLFHYFFFHKSLVWTLNSWTLLFLNASARLFTVTAALNDITHSRWCHCCAPPGRYHNTGSYCSPGIHNTTHPVYNRLSLVKYGWIFVRWRFFGGRLWIWRTSLPFWARVYDKTTKQCMSTNRW